MIKSADLAEENQVHFRSKIKEFSHKSRSVENLLNNMFSNHSSSQSASNSSRSGWQQNVSNILPIFFQELFPSSSEINQHDGQNPYPGNTSHSTRQSPSNARSFRPQQYTQPASSTQANSPPKSTTPVPAPEDVPTIPHIIKENIDVKSLSSKTIKAILRKYNVNYGGILEKSELEERLATLIQNMRLEALQANEDLLW